MKRKRIPATLTVFAVSAGLLTLSAIAVPRLGATTQVNALSSPQAYQSNKLIDLPETAFVSSRVPLLKVEGKTPSSTVEDYLSESMTEAELQQIYDYLDHIKGESELGTRKMSEQENKRLAALNAQYMYDGVRPQKKLPLKAGEASFYLDLKNDKFVYPKRELTNEELLQYIDWHARVNYAGAKRYQAPQPDAKDISKEAAAQKAIQSVKKLFDVDVSKLQMSVAYNKFGPAQKGQWNVHFQPYQMEKLLTDGKAFMMYDVYIDSMSGQVVDTTVTDSAYKRTPITEAIAKKIQQDASWVTAAKDIVVKKQGEKRAIKKSSIVKADQYNKRGTVAISLELEDGSSYLAELRYPEQILRCLIYEPAVSTKK
ncbi:hypothetical protein [Paenibacillus sp. NPDC058174]|uniref:hypothetical protein n=1 Tax=Paenibacillus sp. NPDC058174 TaxID=3346366 RepID=UPI0036D7FF92